ncbi:hypothetical protein DCCM_0407 [Desulfocucumis palustris]|uniref:Carbohydrate-binding module family 96 domain-containing protein n=1 Tax=Desulfocucumis palustris TaxID=1898651 RepID=A0A2L2XDB0_9FIRM|nr:DNRLRE domain-containing protein [Desulfocucumis palustris]GBF32216.1 hypothetical protein DCCM_0407 [Desulfocucumis palustris]
MTYFNKMFGRLGTVLTDGREQAEGKILVRSPGKSGAEGAIAIPVHNRVFGRVEDITEPPRTILRYSPVRDAFVRSRVPALSYGFEQQLIIGSGTEEYRSYLVFDVRIPQGVALDKAELRLTGFSEDSGADCFLYSAATNWRESDINWKNQPGAGGLIVTSRSGYELKFDLLSCIEAFRAGGGAGEIGFVVEGAGLQYYYSREGSIPPVLEVVYYDPNVMSFGRSAKRGSMRVQRPDKRGVPAVLEVVGHWRNNDVPGVITVHRDDVSPACLIVSRPETPGALLIRQADKGIITGSLVVGKPNSLFCEGVLHVNKPDVPVTLAVSFNNSVEGAIQVFTTDSDDTEAVVAVTRAQETGVVGVKPKNEVSSVMAVRSSVDESVESSMAVSRPGAPGKLFIKENHVVAGRIAVRNLSSENVRSEIIVNRPSAAGVIYIKDSGYATGRIVVRNSSSESIGSEIIVNRPSASGVIHIKDSGYATGRIVVRNSSSESIGSEIIVNHPSAAGVIHIKDSGYVAGRIIVRNSSSENVGSEIIVNHPSAVGVIHIKVSGYAPGRLFINQPGIIGLICIKHDKYIPGNLTVGKPVLEGSIAVKAHGNVPGRISVRKVESLLGRLFISHPQVAGAVELKEKKQTSGRILVRAGGATKQPAFIRIKLNHIKRAVMNITGAGVVPGVLGIVSQCVFGKIHIPAYDGSEEPGVVEVRVKYLSDVGSVLRIGHGSIVSGSMVISKRKVHGSLVLGKPLILGALGVSRPIEHGRVVISKYFTYGKILLKLRNRAEGNIVIRRYDEKHVVSRMAVSCPAACGVVTVKEKPGVPGVIVIRRFDEIGVQSSLSVSRPAVFAGMAVSRKHQQGVLRVSHPQKAGGLAVNRPAERGSIEVKCAETVPGEVHVRLNSEKSIYSRIAVSKTTVDCRMGVNKPAAGCCIGVSKLASNCCMEIRKATCGYAFIM